MLLLLSSLFTRPDDRHNREYFNIAICLLGTPHQVSCCHFDGKLELPTRYVKPEAADRLSCLPQYLLPSSLFLILKSLSISRTWCVLNCRNHQYAVWRNPFTKDLHSIPKFMALLEVFSWEMVSERFMTVLGREKTDMWWDRPTERSWELQSADQPTPAAETPMLHVSMFSQIHLPPHINHCSYVKKVIVPVSHHWLHSCLRQSNSLFHFNFCTWRHITLLGSWAQRCADLALQHCREGITKQASRGTR